MYNTDYSYKNNVHASANSFNSYNYLQSSNPDRASSRESNGGVVPVSRGSNKISVEEAKEERDEWRDKWNMYSRQGMRDGGVEGYNGGKRMEDKYDLDGHRRENRVKNVKYSSQFDEEKLASGMGEIKEFTIVCPIC